LQKDMQQLQLSPNKSHSAEEEVARVAISGLFVAGSTTTARIISWSAKTVVELAAPVLALFHHFESNDLRTKYLYHKA